MKNLNLENVDCHATLAMIEKRWGFPRRTLRALLGMTKNAQSGRSMIEMLGVLAIIGVLSVGGIAGYSKAMMKYRINKTIEQITLIAGNVRAFFAPQRSYEGLNSNVAKKAKLVPDEMWDGNDIKNVFGQNVYLSTAHTGKQAFSIALSGLPREACIELTTQDWNYANLNGISFDDIYDFKTPVSIENAVDQCADENEIVFVFDYPNFQDGEH